MSKTKLRDNPSEVLEHIDRLGDSMDIRYLLKYFKFGKYEISRNILKRLYIIISSVDSNSMLFKTKYEPAFVSHEFIRKLSAHFLSKYSLRHPDILTARVFIILLHLCGKTDNLTISTMEATHCLQYILTIFIKTIKLFKVPMYSLNWKTPEKNIFYIVWHAIPCLFNKIIIDKTDINEEISPVCKNIFIQAIKFCKLYASGDTLNNGWKKELPVGVFDYINNILKYKQYLNLFNELNAIDIFIRWLRLNSVYVQSGYVINIIYSYVVNFPEESLRANIIPNLLQYMFKNQKNVCNGIYLGRKYCGLGDICQILKFLINHTQHAVASYPFEKTIKFLLLMMEYCDSDCISKVFAYELIFIIRDIYKSPTFEKQSVTNTFDDVMKLAKSIKQQLDIISDIKYRIQNYLHGGYNFEEDGDEEEEEILPSFLSDSELAYSSEASPEYDSSSSEKAGESNHQTVEAIIIASSSNVYYDGVGGHEEIVKENQLQDEEIQTISSPDYDSDSIEMMSVQESEGDEATRMDLSPIDDECILFPNGDQPMELIDRVVKSNFWPVNHKENNAEFDEEFNRDGDDSMSTDEDNWYYDELKQELLEKIRSINTSIKLGIN